MPFLPQLDPGVPLLCPYGDDDRRELSRFGLQLSVQGVLHAGIPATPHTNQPHTAVTKA